MPNLLAALALIFVPLICTIGGGQTVVADIHRQVVDVHHWMTWFISMPLRFWRRGHGNAGSSARPHSCFTG